MKLFYFFLLVKFALFDEFSDFQNSPIMQNVQKCMDAENQDQCFSITFSNNDYHCCFLEIKYEPKKNKTENNDESTCMYIAMSFDLLKNTSEDKAYKEYLKELFGYINNGIYYIDDYGKRIYPANIKLNQTFICKEGTTKISIGYDVYTQNEIKIIESEKHCLKYFYRYLFNENYEYNEENLFSLKPVSRNECFNADLLKSSKYTVISCGYYEFKIKYVGGTSKKLTTCYLVNPNFYKNGEFDSQTKSELESFILYINRQNGEYSQSYEATFSDSQGNTYVYNSLTGKIESSTTSNSSNGSSFVNLNFIILFIFLFL